MNGEGRPHKAARHETSSLDEATASVTRGSDTEEYLKGRVRVLGQRLNISVVPAAAFEDLLAHFGSRVRVAQFLNATQKAGDR